MCINIYDINIYLSIEGQLRSAILQKKIPIMILIIDSAPQHLCNKLLADPFVM